MPSAKPDFDAVFNGTINYISAQKGKIDLVILEKPPTAAFQSRMKAIFDDIFSTDPTGFTRDYINKQSLTPTQKELRLKIAEGFFLFCDQFYSSASSWHMELLPFHVDRRDQWKRVLASLAYVADDKIDATAVDMATYKEITPAKIDELEGFTLVTRAKILAKDKKAELPPRVQEEVDITNILKPESIAIHTEVNSPGRPVFAPSALRFLGLIYQPAFKVPYVGEQQIMMADRFKFEKDKITWKEKSPDLFMQVEGCGQPVLYAAKKEGLISDSVFGKLYPKAEPHIGAAPTFTKEEAETKFSPKAVAIAQIEYYRAQAIKCLKRVKLDGKIGFVDTWMERLMDVPPGLDNVQAAKTFFLSIKHDCNSDKPTTEVNSTFNSFMMGQLAKWKAGQSRTEMINTNMASVKHYWKDGASLYISEFKKTEEGAYDVRPKYSFLIEKAKKLSKQPGNAYIAAKATAATVARSSAKTFNEIVAQTNSDLRDVEALTEDLSWWDRARVSLTFFKTKYLTKVTLKKVQGRWTKVVESTTPLFGFFKTLFYKAEKNTVTNDDGEVTSFEFKFEKRAWFAKATSLLPNLATSASRAFKYSIQWFGAHFNAGVTHDISPPILLVDERKAED